MKRYPIQKAKNLKGSPIGMYGSLKMDGMHTIWDGGITRGMDCKDVPFANPNAGGRKATGLWSQYLHPVSAPEWWLDGMPRVMASGELWGQGLIRDHIMACKRHEPGEIWDRIKFNCFTLIPPISFFRGGKIDLPHCKVDMTPAFGWGMQFGFQVDMKPSYTFYQRLFHLRTLTQYPVFKPVTQLKIDRLDQVQQLKDQLTPCHDGLIFAKEQALWEPIRNDAVQKDKDSKDSEGVITGFKMATEGTWKGLVGSIELEWQGITFNLSGMNKAERQPGYHRLGDEVTFKYRAVTKDGIPVEARYWRKR